MDSSNSIWLINLRRGKQQQRSKWILKKINKLKLDFEMLCSSRNGYIHEYIMPSSMILILNLVWKKKESKMTKRMMGLFIRINGSVSSSSFLRGVSIPPVISLSPVLPLSPLSPPSTKLTCQGSSAETEKSTEVGARASYKGKSDYWMQLLEAIFNKKYINVKFTWCCLLNILRYESKRTTSNQNQFQYITREQRIWMSGIQLIVCHF